MRLFVMSLELNFIVKVSETFIDWALRANRPRHHLSSLLAFLESFEGSFLLALLSRPVDNNKTFSLEYSLL